MASAGQPITMNLQDSGEGMVPFGQAEPPPQPTVTQSSRPVKEMPSAAFGPPPKNPTDSITENKTVMMDSTPIDDVLSPEEMQGPPPQMMPTQIPAAQGAMMMQPQSPPPSQGRKAESQNPLNLTDEQMQALMVAVAAAMAFSDPVQEKLGTSIPNFLVDGERGTTGLVVSGLVAAALFYFGHRFMMR
jgi:hypothetical protein